MHIAGKYIKLLLLFFPVSVVALIICLFSGHPAVENKMASPQQVRNAVKHYYYMTNLLFAPHPYIELKISQNNLNDLTASVSHLFPDINVEGHLSDRKAILRATYNIRNRWYDFYINIQCTLIQEAESRNLDHCQIGNLRIPGIVLHHVLNLSLSAYFDDSTKKTINQLISNVQINKHLILLTADKHVHFEQRIKNGFKNAASAVKVFNAETINSYDPRLINNYLRVMLYPDWPEHTESLSLSFVVHRAFRYAKLRSQNNDPRIENDTALWAIAIAFANPDFAKYISVNTPELRKTLSEYPDNVLTLSGRPDLVKHFLYSAIIESLGSHTLSVHAGELKELYDTNPKGSGFDFSDLAADIAGATFSRFISSTIDNANYSQKLLASNTGESIFFPDINQLPIPLKSKDFDILIGSTKTKQYQVVLKKIDFDINSLLLYQAAGSSAK
ncbi:hypothetical protein [Vibrio salinus]|uniref:hypothetical protein n=1 Tax=Vibrio salinus TaxID=2899784 RepID=UPI001E51B02F|nr:hypothetical protein [Vibrio salinus]MCE0495618.1 hypothetical protein [Vibrio salinus]